MTGAKIGMQFFNPSSHSNNVSQPQLNLSLSSNQSKKSTINIMSNMYQALSSLKPRPLGSCGGK